MPLPPPPRTVHGGPGFGVWFARLFIMPHLCCGIGLLGFVLITALTAAFGTDVTALVTNAHTSRGSKGSTNYSLDYRYRIGGTEYTHSSSVGARTYSSCAPAGRLHDAEGPVARLHVRHLGFGPWHYQAVVEEGSLWKIAGGMFLMALFWNGIVSVFVYVLWVAPIRNRRLIRSGETTAGKVLKTRISRGKSTSYYATFGFTDPATGQEIQREMSLPGRPQYNQACAVQSVTVIYDPRHPRHALAYELSGYRVADSSPNGLEHAG